MTAVTTIMSRVAFDDTHRRFFFVVLCNVTVYLKTAVTMIMSHVAFSDTHRRFLPLQVNYLLLCSRVHTHGVVSAVTSLKIPVYHQIQAECHIYDTQFHWSAPIAADTVVQLSLTAHWSL